jgi:GNAT superfamily N-acetyltransferase
MKVGPKLPRTVVLDDGRKLSIRAITADDRAALRAAFHRLSPETRYRRFFGHFSDLTPSMLTYLTEVDGHDHFAVVATLKGRRKRGAPVELVGVARMIRLSRDTTAAEVAITVTDALQGLGLGGKLLDTLVEAAGARGIETLVAHVLDGNAPMRHLLAKEGAIETRKDGALYVTLARPEWPERFFGFTPHEPRSIRRGREAVTRVLVALLRRPPPAASPPP